MKVFLDTNVLVSASTTRGLCADVLREVLLSHDLFLADCLIEELKFVLQGKLGIPSTVVDEYSNMLRSDAVFTKRHVELLSGAAASGTDIFVTGDKELLALEKALNMTIVSSRVFWETLKIKTTG
ncbi:MAG: putative toxin-antitoxin system toxin component, PIN family [Acidobacteria bacterium]|nr:putative toxin-antitoxin system toxin component, PIN family [Acidobacteriota bacterium]MBU4255226.1 putative toxin-antitoxin system toxin component, PIN family [Acidobacteriota bacterium]